MSNNGANLGFEQKLWTAADKMRNNMDAAEMLFKRAVKTLKDEMSKASEKCEYCKLRENR